ncbi:putative E3 ubiquitin-protein ligase RING1a [Selaginella moellendorffii]|uniref:putative E3 ubiquitin-protein ligase RING1a n=1 Tax=Selaginella moellendorffii TaxID=88036 RepID=UPI000D1C5B74|nr:putative E3 ubiquitin-protein ligase RING1a [Selaginella moellendorffii]|eukprot:XP_024529869.1 putative E3 ubiquitin-protein ligase RING1a [Selaginella moellendorffii]
MPSEERGNGGEAPNEDPSPECSNDAAAAPAVDATTPADAATAAATAATAGDGPVAADATPAQSPPVDGSNEYITVYLSEIRKEMQCPICLGIIRKTRTVMECLHRFCRECIDKSMRLGNNECPACRTHCASRRSLRDDPNFDSLIAALYQDIDKYEEEEMSLLEEETWKNKQIQADIAETAKRQSEALAKRRTAKATAAAIVRKAHGKFRPVSGRRGRGGSRRRSSRRELSPLEDESDYYMEKDVPVEPRRTSTRKRQRPVTFDSSLSVSIEEESNDSDDEVDDVVARRRHASPATGNGDAMVTWARAGTRSHTRYGSVSTGAGNSARHLRCMRATVLLESLAAATYKDINELDVQFSLMPMMDDSNAANNLPSLERPHLCCSPKLSIQQVCSFLMSHDLFPMDTELEIVAECDCRDPLVREKLQNKEPSANSGKFVEILDMNATLGDVYTAYWNRYNNLSLLYRRKCQ